MDYDLVSKPEFWRELIPELTISAAQDGLHGSQVSLGAEGFSRERLIDEGYQKFDAIVPPKVINTLRFGVEQLHQKNWLPVFGFLYDEYWRAVASLRDLIVQALGFEARMMPDFWVWYVDPSKEDTGWNPHREKTYNTLLPDGMPKCMTAWVPLTDAEPMNGCLYFVPANRDPAYLQCLSKHPAVEFQNIRAVPAAAGSVLIFNEMIYHWGGRSSKYAKQPRLSMACEFQRGDVKPYNKPLLDLKALPSFELRWKLIGKQILQYEHMYAYPEGVMDLAYRMIGQDSPRKEQTKKTSLDLSSIYE